VKVGDDEAGEVLVLDVNLPGLAFEPAAKTSVGETLTIGFYNYPDVAPPFALVARVRSTLTRDVDGEPTGLGVDIDRGTLRRTRSRTTRGWCDNICIIDHCSTKTLQVLSSASAKAVPGSVG
jgi:hypothetical protein